MKKATLLLETILSLIIATSIFILSSILYINIFKTNQEEYANTIVLNDLFSTQLFLYKQFANSHIVNTNSNIIEFYKFDDIGLKQGLFSEFVDLEKSSKEYIYTPQSQTTKIVFSKILFPNGSIFELKTSEKNNYLYFKNDSPKRVFKEYKIIKDKSTISYNNETIYYNNNILQDNITKFNVTKNNQNIFVDICLEKLCKKWIF